MSRSLAAKTLTVESLDRAKRLAHELARGALRLKHCRYADIRLEIVEIKTAAAENGHSNMASDDYTFGFSVRVLAGTPFASPGYYSHRLGAADLMRLPRILKDALKHAYERAIANARGKVQARAAFPALADTLRDLPLAPIDVRQDTVKAEYAIDPRSVSLSEVTRYATEVSRAVGDLAAAIRFNRIAATTSVSRELFASSEGALIDQSFATTLGFCFIAADNGRAEQSLYDYIGHQRGWEVVTEGTRSEFIRHLDLLTFATSLGHDCLKLIDAPALKAT